MTSILQNTTKGGEYWKTIYQAFSSINFNAYDFDTIRNSLINYIRINYSEQFNDWIASSEFVAIIDLVAYLGQSLAYRIDLNARENFIDIADRKESVLRLAQYLSYKPKRNIPARGLLRIESVATNDDVIDFFGKNLNGIQILWNDPNNPNWFDQFILILNNAFTSSNKFGLPVSRADFNGIIQQVYQLNTIPFGFGIKNFTVTVDGFSLPCDVTSLTLDNAGIISEREPNQFSPVNILYRNDGNGFSSPNTGFFFLFKQGSLGYSDFRLDYPIENRTLDIDIPNINEFDVWVQTINEAGIPIQSWKRVPALVGNNVIYNAISKEERNLFEVITRNDDKISIRFGDNRFAKAPTGIIRVLYRTSLGERISIESSDIQTINLSYSYYNDKNQPKTIKFQLSLTQNVANSLPSQSIEEIRFAAPNVYYSQNRMVNGEDYNVLPLSNSNAIKISAYNRIYSGHSRYFDIIDPTTKYKPSICIGDDGILYEAYNTREISQRTTILPNNNSNLSNDDIIFQYIESILRDQNFKQFVLNSLKNNTNFPLGTAPNNPAAAQYNPWSPSQPLRWFLSQNSNYSTTGYFYIDTSISGDDSNPADRNNPIQIDIVPPQNPYQVISPYSYVKFDNGIWATVLEVITNGNGLLPNGAGKVKLNKNIPMGAKVVKVVPGFRTFFNLAEIDNIRNVLSNNPNEFAIYWNWFTQSWEIYSFNNETPSQDHSNFVLISLPQTELLNVTKRKNGWLIAFSNSLLSSTIKSFVLKNRNLVYVFESEKNVRFYFTNNQKDAIKLLPINIEQSSIIYSPAPFDSWKNTSISGTPIKKEISLKILNKFVERDGWENPARVYIGYQNADFDEFFDDIDSIEQIIIANRNVYWESKTDRFGYKLYVPALHVRERFDASTLNIPTLPSLKEGEIVFLTNLQKFYKVLVDNPSNIGDLEELPRGAYKKFKGRAKLYFSWYHHSQETTRIDPAVSNIIDVYVLEKEYDRKYRQWVKTPNAVPDDNNNPPTPPSPFELQLIFQDITELKMISDQIVYHPVKYKALFGSKAEPELQAKIIVVKLPSSNLSDGEIKTTIIQAMEEYFQPENWSFGQPFFFSELSAYIHLRLSNSISSVVLVPKNEIAKFGNLYEIKMNENELPISVATVDDIEIVPSLNEDVLKILGG